MGTPTNSPLLLHTAAQGESRAAAVGRDEWLFTPLGEPRGYIQPHTLSELWFHTGTACNLACPFCLEGSRPGDRRLARVTFADLVPFIDEGAALGVRQFSFTGGEPFLVRDLVRILEYALALAFLQGSSVLRQRSLQGIRRGQAAPCDLDGGQRSLQGGRHDAQQGGR
ncbi:MAG: radical SAM protein [Gammaproteobacteria bacterium]|nr:MAG: radical SAM protein [Gammaproteobacteria bacterium]